SACCPFSLGNVGSRLSPRGPWQFWQVVVAFDTASADWLSASCAAISVPSRHAPATPLLNRFCFTTFVPPPEIGLFKTQARDKETEDCCLRRCGPRRRNSTRRR